MPGKMKNDDEERLLLSTRKIGENRNLSDPFGWCAAAISKVLTDLLAGRAPELDHGLIHYN